MDEESDYCEVCGEELTEESHWHCGHCGELCSVMGHWKKNDGYDCDKVKADTYQSQYDIWFPKNVAQESGGWLTQ